MDESQFKELEFLLHRYLFWCDHSVNSLSRVENSVVQLAYFLIHKHNEIYKKSDQVSSV